MEYAKRRKKCAIVLGAFGCTFYGAYWVYNLPSVVEKRRRLSKLFTAFVSVAEMVSDSADAVGILSKDLKDFLGSDSDRIPRSLKQLSKIAKSDEFSESLTRITRALAVGILHGSSFGGDKCFSDRVMDKIFSGTGAGFASVVVGSFARNLVMALFTEWQRIGGSEIDQSVSRWVEVVCDEKCRELIGDLIRVFVSTAVTVYLDKTMNVNVFDEIFDSLTNPKHEARVRDMLASVCNGAVETCVQTSYNVWTRNSKANPTYSKIDHEDSFGGSAKSTLQGKKLRGKNQDSGAFMRKMRSTLAVPKNKEFVLDMTGTVIYETVRSFLEFLLEKVSQRTKRSLDIVHREVVDRGVETIRHVSQKGKSSEVKMMCLTLCLNVMNSPWILTPPYQ